MKLLTHNFLSSKFLKNVSTGYPLELHVETLKIHDTPFNRDFLRNILSKLDYSAFLSVATSIGKGTDLPPSIGPFEDLTDDQLQAIHHILMCTEIVEGHLKCPESGKTFPIKDGIPNMLVSEEDLP